MAETLSCDAIIDGGLVERYLAGRLSEAEVEAFESHYLTCARCQTELRLAATIRDVLPEVQESAAAEVTRTDAARRWFGGRAAVAATAAAIAAVLAGVLLVQPSRVESPRHREAAPEAEAVPTATAPVGEVGAVEAFRWAPVAGADLYRVTLYDAAGNVIWQFDTDETHATWPDTTRLVAGALYLWQVDARVGWDRWVGSELARFTVHER